MKMEKEFIIIIVGNIFEGNYRNGIREGKGIYYYNCCDIFDGNYKNGIR